MICWGFHKPVTCEHKGMPALRFKVNGMKFEGSVMVALNEGSDTYEIYTYQEGWDDWKLEEVNVFCEDLTATLDTLIET